MRKLLESIKSDELLDFIYEYSNYDINFRNALNARFTVSNFDDELKKIRIKINNSFDGVENYRHRGSWGHVAVDTSNIVFEIRQLAQQGNIKLAFAQTEILYLKLLTLLEYQEECELSDEAESCIDLMSDIADKVIEASDGDYIYDRCLELADNDEGEDYGVDFEHKLLALASRFVTQYNRHKLEKKLINYKTWCNTKQFNQIQLNMIKRLDGEDATNDFITANLDDPKIREIAYNNAIEVNDYSEAERLCLDVISSNNTLQSRVWLYKIYEVYELINDTDKKATTAESILLLGDLTYYSKLKVFLTETNQWKDVYPILLEKCGKHLYYSNYMKILNIENEFALLFEQLKLHHSSIYEYGKILKPYYEKDICNIFIEQIDLEAKKANTRKAYQKVSKFIKIFLDAGYVSNVEQLVAEYKVKYKRRPTFVEEICKIQ